MKLLTHSSAVHNSKLCTVKYKPIINYYSAIIIILEADDCLLKKNKEKDDENVGRNVVIYFFNLLITVSVRQASKANLVLSYIDVILYTRKVELPLYFACLLHSSKQKTFNFGSSTFKIHAALILMGA